MTVDDCKRKEIFKAVTYILHKFHNRDPFYIARNLGIECRFPDLTSETYALSGIFEPDNKSYILINKNLTSYAQKIVCAHELGHLILHRNDSLNCFDKNIDPLHEYEANCFASYLLPQLTVRIEMKKMSVEDFNNHITDIIKVSNW